LDKVEQLLPTYLPYISQLAKQSFQHQHIAADIAAQGHLLSYVVASNQEDFKQAQFYCQQARTYAQTARDRNLEATALIRQGVVGLHRKRPYQTLTLYQEAFQFVDEVSPLVRTRLYASLCEIQGKLGMEQDALQNIRLAQENFPDNQENDPAVAYIHFNKSGLYLHEGLALLDLHKPQDALDALLHVDGLHPKMDISERSRIDVLNQQARSVGEIGDLEQFKLYLESAVTSAHKIGSELRYSETWDTYKHVYRLWGHESQVRSLTRLFEM
jgi:tetratricopeptide (TPR) repeat protein